MTTTVDKTLAGILTEANPNTLPDAFRKVDMGQLLTPQKREITIASAATMTLDPPALGLAGMYVNVTTGTATGVRLVQDDTITPSATIATLSDDGATLTFEAVITVAIVDYLPRSETDVTADFPQTGNG